MKGVINITANVTYTDADLAPVVVDSAVKVGVGIGAFAGIIGLMLGVAIGVGVFKLITKK
jgi:hypothetical protein